MKFSIYNKLLFFSLLFLLFNSDGLAQNSQSSAFNKVKSLYNSTSLGCKAIRKQCSIYFNRSEKALEIIDYLIPLSSVEVKYRYDTEIPQARHFVQFNCRSDDNCLYNSQDQKYSIGISVPFSSKQACYNFIDAIAELKESLGL